MDGDAEEEGVPDEGEDDGHRPGDGNDAGRFVLEGERHEELVADAGEADAHQPGPFDTASLWPDDLVDKVQGHKSGDARGDAEPEDHHVDGNALQLSQHDHAEGGGNSRDDGQRHALVVYGGQQGWIKVLQEELGLRHTNDAHQGDHSSEDVKRCNAFSEDEVGEDEDEDGGAELNGTGVGQRN